jgi:hypothetical protein
MVAAFVASASFSLLSAILCLTLYSNSSLKYNNPFDRFWRRILCDPIQRLVGPESARTWSNSLYAIIMAISDQQIITGIAILSASIRALEQRSITVYHFNIIMDMAWLSSNVNLICLCVMRSFLDSTHLSNAISYSRSHSPVPRFLRIVAMLVLAALLLHCSSISGYELWDDHVNCPALCITRGKRGGYPHRQMIVTFIFVIQSYTFQIARVTPAIRRFFSKALKPRFQSLDQKMTGRLENSTFRLLLYAGVRRAAVVLWYFFTSDFEFMLEMLAWFVLGLYWTFTDRKEGHNHMEHDEIWKENHIGFGQLVPLLLIVLATLAGMEAYICKLYISISRNLKLTLPIRSGYRLE